MQFINLPKANIPDLVIKYIAELETGDTEIWCRCSWEFHPDDIGKQLGNCRECGASKIASGHQLGGAAYHEFMGIRKRRVDTETTCPVHTKEGMLLYFFEWAMSNAVGN